LNNIRDEWPTNLNEASLVANNLNIIPNFPEEERRAKKRKVFHVEVQSETFIQTNKAIVAQDSFKRNVIFNSIDVIITDLTHLFEAHKNLCNLFSPILCYMKLSCEELEVNLKKMIKIYPNDLSPNMLDELFHLKKNSFISFSNRNRNIATKTIKRNVCKEIRNSFYKYFCCFKNILYTTNDSL
jgi:hypothetical protein